MRRTQRHPATDPASQAAKPSRGKGGSRRREASPTGKAADASALSPLEVEILQTGNDLLQSVSVVVNSISTPQSGPQELANRLGLDKVLTSRLLRSVRATDPMAAIHRSPGPEPLRRFLRSAARLGVDAALIETARKAVTRFDNLITNELGDRSALDTVVAAWLPDARREFQLRRQQLAFRSMSQLKGSQAQSILATVLLSPSPDQKHLDVVWLSGLIGLQRISPGAAVKLATRRLSPNEPERRPRTLDDVPIADHRSARVEEFCSQPAPPLLVHQNGDVVHYTLGPGAFGPRHSADLIFAEVNRAEMRRYIPPESGRKAYVFAEVSTPAFCLQFDVLVHQDVYPGSSPALRIYDTAFEGIADANNPARDIDRLDILESVQDLGRSAARLASADVPRYAELLTHTFTKLKWNPDEFQVYRCRIEYPIYGTQATLVFDAPAPPA